VDSISNIINNGLVIQQEKHKSDMPSADAIRATEKWVRMIQACYNSKELTKDAVIVWAGLLGKCNDSIMTKAVKEWMAIEPKAPKPAELLALYKQKCKRGDYAQTANYVMAESPDGEPLYRCPYCQDNGFLAFQRNEPDMYGDIDYWPCSCDKRIGSLGAILADPRYWWDVKKKRFSLKWAGDKGGEAS